MRCATWRLGLRRCAQPCRPRPFLCVQAEPSWVLLCSDSQESIWQAAHSSVCQEVREAHLSLHTLVQACSMATMLAQALVAKHAPDAPPAGKVPGNVLLPNALYRQAHNPGKPSNTPECACVTVPHIVCLLRIGPATS